MAKEYLEITEEIGVARIDKLIADTFPQYSRSALSKLFLMNLIKRDGISLRPGEKVRPGAVIEYDLGPLQETPDVIPLPIIYEDDNITVVNKPAGIISHARGRFWQEASVASFIRDRISGMEGERGGIVHRLDRATSGVMICARNEASLKFFQKQFHDRLVLKSYIAITSVCPKEKEAKIIAAIARNLKDPKTFHVNTTGKIAETHYKVLKEEKKRYTVELKPKTGRTHQLRVHLNYINCPIIGDELYGGDKNVRLLLHAHKLTIKLPDGKSKTFTAPLPEEFK
ncbi:MAG: 23S rRNA pseudouridine1911/1915/1917 synthase [Candidatus Saccharimonadales bacterium]|jgi:23S rRNA pseudouridine1911/1915/1917 synthase